MQLEFTFYCLWEESDNKGISYEFECDTKIYQIELIADDSARVSAAKRVHCHQQSTRSDIFLVSHSQRVSELFSPP